MDMNFGGFCFERGMMILGLRLCSKLCLRWFVFGFLDVLVSELGLAVYIGFGRVMLSLEISNVS